MVIFDVAPIWSTLLVPFAEESRFTWINLECCGVAGIFETRFTVVCNLNTANEGFLRFVVNVYGGIAAHWSCVLATFTEAYEFDTFVHDSFDLEPTGLSLFITPVCGEYVTYVDSRFWSINFGYVVGVEYCGG